MRKRRHGRHTELFLLRIWVDTGSHHTDGSLDEKWVWRGVLQQVVNGESREFNDWQTLKVALMIMLSWPEDEVASGEI